MEAVKNIDDVSKLKDNIFLGSMPQITNSTINFTGKGNVIYCEENVKIEGSSISFPGDNGLLYLASLPEHPRLIRINCAIHNNCVCYIGGNTYFNVPPVTMLCSEQKHIFIGANCLISRGIWMCSADPHLIYSISTKKRVNPSKSIFIGDNVWIGQNVLILKGTQIHSGSIVGGNSVLANKKIMSNCSVAGNPAKVIAENIFWEDQCVHNWKDGQTKRSMTSENTDCIFSFDQNEYISFDEIDSVLSEKISASEKVRKTQELLYIYIYRKNRFALF